MVRRPKGNGGSSRIGTKRQANADRTRNREELIYDLRVQGKRFGEIAAIVGITRQGVEAAFYRVMQAIPPQDAEEHRTASLERIGQIRSTIWEKLDPKPPPMPKIKAKAKEAEPPQPGDTTVEPATRPAPALIPPQIGEQCALCGHKRGSENAIAAANTLVRLEEREAKLLGLDAPTKVDIRLGAPKRVAVDPKSREEAVERLTIDEQRTLLHLIRKCRGEPPYPEPPLLAPQANGLDPDPDDD